MKNLRVAVSTLAAFALTLGAITGIGVLPAVADVVYPTIGEFSYRADNTAISAGATITGYTGAGGVVDIPASVDIDGTPYAVTTIGGSAFSNKQLTAVTIPASVTAIGQSAFRENPLTTVALPASLTTLGGDAFRSNRLTTINIPSGGTAIGSTTFTTTY
jgi:hypothetical protein